MVAAVSEKKLEPDGPVNQEMPMSSSPRTLLAIAALSSALVLPSIASAATSRGVSMEILVDGRPLRELTADRGTYVKARKNRNYTVRLRNDTGARVAVALAVDGLNSIDAKHTAARDAAKWVLSPYETAEIQGWQVDDGHARKFLFTSEEKSYGAWIGDSRNLGVVSAVFFAEQSREVCCVEPRPHEVHRDDNNGVASRDEEAQSRGSLRRGGEGGGSARKPSPPPQAEAADDASALAGAGSSSTSDGESIAVPGPAKKKEERAATGMGSKTRHEVQWTQFAMDPRPIASFDMRYAYRGELVALGIDPDWSPVTPAVRRRERAAGFAPDPGVACCR